MNTKTVDIQPKTDEKYQREIDRMILQTEATLKNTREISERAKRVGRESNRILDALEARHLCVKERARSRLMCGE